MGTADQVAGDLAKFWTSYQDAIILGGGLLALVLVLVALVKFIRTKERSKVVSTLAALIVMAWTSEGLLHTGLTVIKLPVAFASVTFFVFEAMQIATWLKAEEHRTTKGTPGPAGYYAFVIATVQGVVAALGATSSAEVFLRVILPPLSVGLAWIFMVSERSTDTPEMKAERARRAAEREATWVWTPRTVLIRLGIMKPGTASVTEAQRDHQVTRMIVAADTIAVGHRWSAKLARRRLRRLTRTATPEMVAEVARRARMVSNAERLMVPTLDDQSDQDQVEAARSAVQAVQVQAVQDQAVQDQAVRVNGHGPAEFQAAWLAGHQADRVNGHSVQAHQDAAAPSSSATTVDLSGGRPNVETREAETAPLAGPATDAQLLEEYGDQLRAILAKDGRLTRYKVEKLLGVQKRQAQRVIDTITGEADEMAEARR